MTKTGLRRGDRIVFLGDSITEQGGYAAMVEDQLSLRYPQHRLTCFNAGWAGDTATAALQRLDRDVLRLRPTLVTLCYGMNDGGYQPPSTATEERFRDALATLVARLRAAGVRVVVLTPGMADVTRNPGFHAIDYSRRTLRRLATIALQVARKAGVPAFDLHRLMTRVDRAAKRVDPAFSMIPDGNHPDAGGHLVMAYALLRALGVPPLRTAVAATRRGEALEVALPRLPYPIPDDARAVLPYLPFQRDYVALPVRLPRRRGGLVLHASSGRVETVTGTSWDLYRQAEGEPAAFAQRVLHFTSTARTIYRRGWRDLALEGIWKFEREADDPHDLEAHDAAITAVEAAVRLRSRLLEGAPTRYRLPVVPAFTDEVVADEFIRSWSALGPLHQAFADDGLGGEASFSARPRTDARWIRLRIRPETEGDCLGLAFGPQEHCVAYLACTLISPVAQAAELRLGSDDGFAAWLNGKALGSRLDIMRGMAPDSDRMPLRLRRGRNVLLLKISQYGSGWGFCARLVGLRRTLLARWLD